MLEDVQASQSFRVTCCVETIHLALHDIILLEPQYSQHSTTPIYVLLFEEHWIVMWPEKMLGKEVGGGTQPHFFGGTGVPLFPSNNAQDTYGRISLSIPVVSPRTATIPTLLRCL
jgi:hypothetical protein